MTASEMRVQEKGTNSVADGLSAAPLLGCCRFNGFRVAVLEGFFLAFLPPFGFFSPLPSLWYDRPDFFLYVVLR